MIFIPMSNDVTSALLKHSKSKGGARAVLLILAWHANDEGYCFPGLQTIAKEAGLTVRGAQKALKTLQEIGEITREANTGFKTAKGYTNGYRLHFRGERGSPHNDDTDGVNVVRVRGERGSPKPSVNNQIEDDELWKVHQRISRPTEEPNEFLKRGHILTKRTKKRKIAVNP